MALLRILCGAVEEDEEEEEMEKMEKEEEANSNSNCIPSVCVLCELIKRPSITYWPTLEVRRERELRDYNRPLGWLGGGGGRKVTQCLVKWGLSAQTGNGSRGVRY